MKNILRVSFFFLVLLLLFSCAPKTQPRPFYWPFPPERPRLKFEGVLRSEADLNVDGWEKFKRELRGYEGGSALTQPTDVASDGKGRVYVAMSLERRVVVFDYNTKRFGEFVRGDTPYLSPFSVSVDGDGKVYIGDVQRHKVFVFTPDGRPLYTIGDESVMENPVCIRIDDERNRVYVVDSFKAKVLVFNKQGELLFELGSKWRGSGDGEFHTPQAVAIDDQGRIFVADTLNARIQVFDVEGNFLYKFGERGTAWSYFEDPKGMAFDSEGNLHIVDYRKSGILTYSPDGEFLLATSRGKAVRNLIGFAGPNAIWIDQDDRMYISDYHNKRIAVWQYLSDAYLDTHPDVYRGGQSPAAE